MKRNTKAELALLTIATAVGALLFAHHSGMQVGAHLPFTIPYLSKQADDDYKPVGKLILDGDYELADGWLLHAEEASLSISKKDLKVFSECATYGDHLRPVPLPGTGGGGYCRDITGDGALDVLIEDSDVASNSDNGTHYSYTLYTLFDNAVERYVTQTFDHPVRLSARPDGTCLMVCKDSTFERFFNDQNLGADIDVSCNWSGNGFTFSADAMQRQAPKADALDKTISDLDSKIVRYDTTCADGTVEKRLEITPQVWEPIVQMVYHGNSAAARKVLDAVWHADETAVFATAPDTRISRREFWDRIWSQLGKSPYGSQIRQLNHV